jgi:hypothetical protein
MGGVGKGEREDGDGGMNFRVKTRSEVARGWAVWSPVLGGWVLLVAGGWLSGEGGREREDGGARERRWGGGKNLGEWKMFNKINDASVFYFLSLKKRTNKKSKKNCHVGRGSDPRPPYRRPRGKDLIAFLQYF